MTKCINCDAVLIDENGKQLQPAHIDKSLPHPMAPYCLPGEWIIPHATKVRLVKKLDSLLDSDTPHDALRAADLLLAIDQATVNNARAAYRNEASRPDLDFEPHKLPAWDDPVEHG